MNRDGNKRVSVDDWKSNLKEKRLKMSGAQAKTPITILQELCAKKNPKELPLYTELSEVLPEYEDQNLRFFIRCQALGMSTIGGGTTKKIAKHSAAEKLLTKSRHSRLTIDDDDEVMQTPDVNCISDLMDFCVLKDYHKPEFSLVTSCGPSHAPTFTIECKLNSVSRTGTAGNKSQAKQLAAKEVLDILKSSYPDIEKKVAVVNGANQTKEIIRQKVTSYLDLKKKDKVDKMGKIIKDRHKFFRTQDEEFVETFSKLLSSEELSDDEKYLKLLDELETMWEYKIEKIEDTELWQFELLIDFDKFTCCIIADSDEKLKSEVLKYFMEMMSINIPQSCETTVNILGELVIENL